METVLLAGALAGLTAAKLALIAAGYATSLKAWRKAPARQAALAGLARTS